MMQARLGRGEASLCFVVAASLAVAAGLRGAPGVLDGDLLNPDTYMRLNRLHDILDAGSPLHAVLRDGSGAGAILHWSHLLDAVLLLLALPMRLVLSWHDALHFAAVLIGPLGIGLTGVAAAWVMAPVLPGSGMRWTAAALVGMAPPVVAYGFPGVAHHHVPLGVMALLLAGAAGRVAVGEARAGVLLGAAAGAGIWLSPEAMPFVLMAFVGGGMAWMLTPRREIADGLALAGAVFLAVTAAALLVDPPMTGWLAVEIDRLSLVYVVLAGVVAGVGWGLRTLGRWSGGALGVAGLLLWIALFPGVLRGPEGVIDSAEARMVMAGIEEMRPVGSLMQGIEFLAAGVIGLGLCGWLALTRRSWLWFYAALCVAVMLGLGAMHLRFATYPTLAGAAALPVALAELTRRLAGRPTRLALSRVGLLAVAMLSTRADAIAGSFRPTAAPRLSLASAGCPMRGLAEMLAPYAGAVVLSEVNDVPELLYRTGVRTVGSLYHRNFVAYGRLHRAWRAVPGDAPGPEFRATGASLVLICRRPARSLMVADLPPETLMDRLAAGNPPAWLARVAGDVEVGYVLYRVVESGSR